MSSIKDVHENVLTFLLQWKKDRDPKLVFSLRKKPAERLHKGYWFVGNDHYLAFTFWTGLDWVNKTPNIYFSIDTNGTTEVRFSAKDSEEKAKILGFAASVLGGFTKVNRKDYIGNMWVKQFEGKDYLTNLEYFLLEDKNRIDTLLENEKQHGDKELFLKALTPLDPQVFQYNLLRVNDYRKDNKTLQDFVPSSVRTLCLEEMTLENTGLFKKCTLQFGKKVTLLIGENGCGKSTLLKATALGLVGTGSTLINTRNSELQYLPTIIGVEEDKIEFVSKGSISLSYVFNGKNFTNGKGNFIPFSYNAGTGEVMFNEDRIADDGFGLPVSEGAFDNDGELPLLVIGYPQRYGKRKDGTNIKKRSIKPNAYDVLPLLLDTEEHRIDSLKLWISENWNSSPQKKESVIKLFKVISAILASSHEPDYKIELKSAISERKIMVITPDNPKGIPFDLLSTGLNNLFGWIGHLISRMFEAYPDLGNPMEGNAVVFVDEIDNYLHPLIQASVIEVLLDYFPNIQFIFTSHSPVMLASLPNKDTKAYRIENKEAIEILHFYGRTVQDVLTEDYGIQKRPAKTIQAKIDKMSKALAMNQIDEAKEIYKELLPILGKNDVAILDAEYELLN